MKKAGIPNKRRADADTELYLRESEDGDAPHRPTKE